MPKVSIVFIFLISQALCVSVSYGMQEDESNENRERNWRQSLNVYDPEGKKVLHSVDDWLTMTLAGINEDMELSIRAKYQRPQKVQQNIAAARFTIISQLDKQLQFFSFDLMKTFMSGLGCLDSEHVEVKGTNLLDLIIFPVSFIAGPRPVGSIIDKTQKDRVNAILGKEVVEAGTHAEESILVYVFNHLKKYLAIEYEGKPPTIIGTILEISSLKDPCTKVCIPMLKAFMDNLHTLLQTKIAREMTLAPKLENLVLVSGRKQHIKSRDGMEIRDEQIRLNFKDPSNRVYSKKID